MPFHIPPVVGPERIPLLLCETSQEVALRVAHRIAEIIREKQSLAKPCVLGLPTGSTPINVYRELIRLHREEGLDFGTVTTFNLDEYSALQASSPHSYHSFMDMYLFEHVNIKRANIHLLNGEVGIKDAAAECERYEAAIAAAGGLDLVVLGIGRSGHIAFNEPQYGVERTKTRLVDLDSTTIADAASGFNGIEHVPHQALTMGVQTILGAKEIILMATGEAKAGIIRKAMEEPPVDAVPASYLQKHPQCCFIVDKGASEQLTRSELPWTVYPDWDVMASDYNLILAVQALCKKLDKTLFALTIEDFEREHLHLPRGVTGDMVTKKVHQIFMENKLNVSLHLPKKGETVLVFSPHPDDDVISAGSIVERMQSNGCNVQVAYCVNGSVAVPNYSLVAYLRFMELALGMLGLKDTQAAFAEHQTVLEELMNETPNPAIIQSLKGAIRSAEAENAIRMLGLPGRSVAHHLNLPFYQTGEIKKNPYTQADVAIVLKLIRDLVPSQIFVAADLSDPNGTHRQCYYVIRDAIREYTAGMAQRPRVWCYRGAWAEYSLSEATFILPMTSAELQRKLLAIYRHESQKDRAMFPGTDPREFWQRARDRNIATAKALGQMGLSQFYAAEAYVYNDGFLPN